MGKADKYEEAISSETTDNEEANAIGETLMLGKLNQVLKSRMREIRTCGSVRVLPLVNREGR